MNVLPSCIGVPRTPSTSRTRYATAATPTAAFLRRIAYAAMPISALIPSVTTYSETPGRGQRHHSVAVLRNTAEKNPPIASNVTTAVRREARECRSRHQPSATN